MAPVQRRASIVAAIVLVVVAVFWFGGPYAALHGLRKAVAARDTNNLDTWVDFPELRRNLAPQVEDRIARGMSARVGGSFNGALLGNAAKVISDNAVNAMATPAGIGVLLQGNALYRQASGDTVGDGVVKQARPADPLGGAHSHFESWNRFSATLPTDGGDVAFVLEPRGWRWKITNIRLPPPKPD